MKLRKLRPSPGVLIGTIALVFALTGAAVAATTIHTENIAKKAVTGPKIASDAVKGGKILDGSVKAKDLASDVVIPDQAFGRVNKSGVNVTAQSGAVGISGVASGGPGVICYDLAFTPVSGTANAATGPAAQPGATVEVTVGPTAGCAAPFTDASTSTKTSTTGNANDNDVYVNFIG